MKQLEIGHPVHSVNTGKVSYKDSWTEEFESSV